MRRRSASGHLVRLRRTHLRCFSAPACCEPVTPRVSRVRYVLSTPCDALASAQNSLGGTKPAAPCAVRLAWRLASLRARRPMASAASAPAPGESPSSPRRSSRRPSVGKKAAEGAPADAAAAQGGGSARAARSSMGPEGKLVLAFGSSGWCVGARVTRNTTAQRCLRAARPRPPSAGAPRVASDGRRGEAAVARADAACARLACAFRVSLAPPRVSRRASQALRLLFGRCQGAQGRGPAPQRVPHRLLRRSQCAPARMLASHFDARTHNAPPAPARLAILVHAAPRPRTPTPCPTRC
jgi:hypothetical protein